MAVNITHEQRKKLKAQAHYLKPVIIIGDKGITENLIKETDSTLTTHELIKVRVNAIDREARKAMAEKLSEDCQAALVHIIGHIAILYRKNLE